MVIECRDVTKVWGDQTARALLALDHLDLSVAPGEAAGGRAQSIPRTDAERILDATDGPRRSRRLQSASRTGPRSRRRLVQRPVARASSVRRFLARGHPPEKGAKGVLGAFLAFRPGAGEGLTTGSSGSGSAK